MAAVRLTAYDIIRRVLAVGTALAGIALFVAGITMFWGPLREVWAAPVVTAVGVVWYVAGSIMWWFVDQDLRARS
jgi:cytochrome b subunit of formate dehydrogenase